MFRAELELFAESCRTGKENELSADNGNAAVAVQYAALRSLEENGRLVRLAEVIDAARSPHAPGAPRAPGAPGRSRNAA
jgi:hypothetical protein